MDVDDYYFCKHGRYHLTKKPTSNGVIQFRNQCLDCGTSFGTAIAKAKVQYPDQVPAFDEDLFKSKKLDEEKKRLAGIEARKENFFREYDIYLKSPQWKYLRERVLKRENYMCQGCGFRKATEVHHTTYENVGDEFMFELLALCSACHNRIHKRPNF